ncbi:mitochondrial ribosomal protein S14 [Dermatophagoides pteronyssinus]|uniref:28S ribosomal protein S14, mitochondrial n=2 Tax=Dermatophagoides pteronyssinus TaxID=6956 RepID=A0ABQ8JAR3_DERPT|nr:28S ribosomal protein S14, mitochondrial-like [Dermatophagoides pteronyssinus]KAH9419679.1 28S ribosomal protein S14, mitochondrial [Dermatophagoides pteronyssinus]
MAFILNKLGNQFKQTIHLINGSFNLIIANQYRFLASNSGKNPFPQYVNLPPISPLSGKGHTFETRIERKRKIEDPNLPSLNSIGELKWATTRMLRDVRRRRVFIDYYPFRQCYYNMRKNQTLPQSVREEAYKLERALPRDSMFHLLHSRCAVTGRSRGIVKRYRLSRFCFRHLADYNKLSGVIKASWN